MNLHDAILDSLDVLPPVPRIDTHIDWRPTIDCTAGVDDNGTGAAVPPLKDVTAVSPRDFGQSAPASFHG